MFDHLLESSHRDDSNRWSNIEFGEEITQVESIEIQFKHFIWTRLILIFFLKLETENKCKTETNSSLEKPHTDTETI